MFDKEFDVKGTKEIFDHYRPVAVIVDVVYILIVIFGKTKLSNITKNKVLLNDISLMWNAFNAVMSIVILSLVLPNFIYGIFSGYHYTVCTEGTYMTSPYSGLGQYLFVLSKFWELGDTIMLMLKGRPIIFLHYYHHAIVLFQTYFSYPNVGSFARLGTGMNSLVHTIMYSYFVITSLYPSFRKYNIFVTLAQLLQFFVGFTSISYGLYVMYSGGKCDSHHYFGIVHLFIYISFFILFSQFFYSSYVNKKNSNKKKND